MIYDEPSGSFQAGAQLKMDMISTNHFVQLKCQYIGKEEYMFIKTDECLP